MDERVGTPGPLGAKYWVEDDELVIEPRYVGPSIDAGPINPPGPTWSGWRVKFRGETREFRLSGDGTPTRVALRDRHGATWELLLPAWHIRPRVQTPKRCSMPPASNRPAIDVEEG